MVIEYITLPYLPQYLFVWNVHRSSVFAYIACCYLTWFPRSSGNRSSLVLSFFPNISSAKHTTVVVCGVTL